MWSAPEYTHIPKNTDWFWSIGLVALVGAGLAVWFHNYIFAIFILLSGASLIMTGIHHPLEVEFEISTAGLRINKDTYSYKKIKGYKMTRGSPYAKLLVETDKYFIPVLTIPVPEEYAQEVNDELMKVLPLLELEESASMIFMEKLGF